MSAPRPWFWDIGDADPFGDAAELAAADAAEMAAARAKRPHRSGAVHQAAWRERQRATPEGAEALRTRQRAAEKRAGPSRNRMRSVRDKRHRDERPFIGVDGEGCGVNEHGQQNYMLLCAGDAELFTGKRLTTLECLNFICDLPGPDEAICVGFSFGYDTTQILRDLPMDKLSWLFRGLPLVANDNADSEDTAEDNADTWTGLTSRYAWYGNFRIEYLPKNYLRVWRSRRTEAGKSKIIPGSCRTIYETFGFFQCKFTKALKDWDIGTLEQREEITANKADRAVFEAINQRVRDYCALECDLLARMMGEFRTVCIETGIRPRTWNGAGKLATVLHAGHDTPSAAELAGIVPFQVFPVASAAYYGGRFEITRVGEIIGRIYEYDIASAYPAMMRSLPCLRHGAWTAVDAAWLRTASADALYVASVRFRHVPVDGRPVGLCGLPLRKPDGRLCWPMQGGGTYWSTEIRAAEKLGCRVTYGTGWTYEKRCECRPFDWVEGLFEKRRALGKDKRGYPLKLAINSLYGKLAQRVGSPKYGNLIWAGLITAGTRAALMDAASSDPDAVLMLATDALFSRRPLPVPLGERLGDWEAVEHERLFIVQPGIYWGAKRPKTRGVSPGFFEEQPVDHGPTYSPTERFERHWRDYAEADQSALKPLHAPPIVSLPMTLFIGLKLAFARGKPDTAGCWLEKPRNFNFDWTAKRGLHAWETPLCAATKPLAGGKNWISKPHASDKSLISQLDFDKADLDDQPDYFDIGPPFQD